MDWNWSQINQIADDAIITMGIAALIVRQFIWRSARLDRMLRMPVFLIGAGIVYLIIELAQGFVWVPADWIIVAELGLVAITGTAMGCATHFRNAHDTLQYRLTWIGIILWAIFVAVRIGNFALASALGADLGAATGLILLSFGINRLAAIAVVRRRALPLVAALSGGSIPHTPDGTRPGGENGTVGAGQHPALGTVGVDGERGECI